LPVDAEDMQQPHTEGEAYYVLSGAARFRLGEDDLPVQAGTVLYVPAGVPHHFHSISAELRLLVFFAPAEGTLGRP
jgi:mannose-6-phosphate isomerase-like protein (cupin superfamily)